ncbi:MULTISPECIES: hypothetical protein [Haloferacaceae]|uniref:Uncharacterized protein n=1 Tax=Halorubrum glutamatedens TaxID=2707018 RepID=A0ABD5QWB2_9EURY|nr:hypothetical protein [Halobellus captivus]
MRTNDTHSERGIPMVTYRRGGYVQGGDDAVERGCDHCEWHVVADSYPELIGAYQRHLKAEHPKAWLRA